MDERTAILASEKTKIVVVRLLLRRLIDRRAPTTAKKHDQIIHACGLGTSRETRRVWR